MKLVLQITELGVSLVSVSDNERSRAAHLLGEVNPLIPGLQV